MDRTPHRVIAHELAHEILHKQSRNEMTRQKRELEAGPVSYAVLAHYGIHTESRFYLASYDVTAEMLAASLQTISQAAKRIISTIDDNGNSYYVHNFAQISDWPSISKCLVGRHKQEPIRVGTQSVQS